MRRFCEDVLKFLRSEYDDSYEFSIERRVVVPARLIPNNEKVELTVKMSPHYKLTLVNDSMMYLFGCYRAGEFIEERGRYRWQKELVDMIEGS